MASASLADENVSLRVVERLRAAGVNGMAIGLTNPGALDRNVLATARRDGRILIMEDRDFGELIVRQRLAVQGIVLLEMNRLSDIAEVDRVVKPITPSSLHNSFSLFDHDNRCRYDDHRTLDDLLGEFTNSEHIQTIIEDGNNQHTQ